MSKGDLALSVTMTSVSTLLSPILTPLITYQLIGQKIAFDPLGMFWSIIQIVIIPICLGLAVKALLPKLAEQATDYLPAVSAIAISLIIAGVIAVSRDNIVKNLRYHSAGRHLPQLPGLSVRLYFSPDHRHELEKSHCAFS